MIKDQLAKKIAESTGIHIDDVEAVLTYYCKIVKTEVAQGNDVIIRKFGRFTLKPKKRKGFGRDRNGNVYELQGGYKAAFVPSESFKELIESNKKNNPKQ
jgi:nucleoid DNA-binding protein